MKDTTKLVSITHATFKVNKARVEVLRRALDNSWWVIDDNGYQFVVDVDDLEDCFTSFMRVVR